MCLIAGIGNRADLRQVGYSTGFKKFKIRVSLKQKEAEVRPKIILVVFNIEDRIIIYLIKVADPLQLLLSALI